MKVYKSVFAFLVAAPLLLVGLAEASPSCPSTSDVVLPFDQKCQNSCTTGADAGLMVGPGVMAADPFCPYEVAGIYFGYQNWGGCVGMVTAMASAYEKLSEEERQRVFLLAVGLDTLKDSNQAFCQGFAACPDDSDETWWRAWDVNQRDVFFYTKQADGSWAYYCRYSMNTNRDEFEDTIREMLEFVDLIVEEVEDDDMVGNETSTNETMTETEESTSEPALAVSDPSASKISSSASYSNRAFFVTMSAAVLGGWSIV